MTVKEEKLLFDIQQVLKKNNMKLLKVMISQNHFTSTYIELEAIEEVGE